MLFNEIAKIVLSLPDSRYMLRKYVLNCILTLKCLCAVVVLAFTLPKAYELKKDEVDNLAAKAHHHGKVSTGTCSTVLTCSLAGGGQQLKPPQTHGAS